MKGEGAAVASRRGTVELAFPESGGTDGFGWQANNSSRAIRVMSSFSWTVYGLAQQRKPVRRLA